MLAALAASVIAAAQPAAAYKWHECPDSPSSVYPSAIGATGSPFIHPGHEIKIMLNAEELAATGGFSVAPGGNEISIVFESVFGNPQAIAPLWAAAVSPSVLTFDFPNAAAETGRVLAGPVAIHVKAGDRLVAHIRATDLIGLPPTTDVTHIVLGESPDEIALAALGADGDLWLPAAFHGDPMAMPECPGDWIHPLAVKIGAAVVDGELPAPFNPLERVRGVVGYLGDILIRDTNFYGMLYPERILLVHLDGTLGVSICRMNDAIDLVLRVKGSRAWAQCEESPFRFAAADSSPIRLRLSAAASVPGEGYEARYFSAAGNRAQSPKDSFGNECKAMPFVELR